ncbi:MAG: hypothetical protein KDE52_01270 [Calditrichaeota bacterium]|nr:hypothetical protein [Calditrichota bacterium]
MKFMAASKGRKVSRCCRFICGEWDKQIALADDFIKICDDLASIVNRKNREGDILSEINALLIRE